jgi:hypothetical protein
MRACLCLCAFCIPLLLLLLIVTLLLVGCWEGFCGSVVEPRG